MRLLAIETSGRIGSVALAVGDRIESREITEPRQQTARLLPLIDELLSSAGIAVKGLDAVAFGHGPGSFTGLRVAAAVAQGLSLGGGVPIVSVSSMAAMLQGAYRKHGATSALVCLDARMDEVYWGHYEIVDGLARAVNPAAIGGPAEVVAPERRPYICIGDGFARYGAEFQPLTAAAELTVDDAVPLATDLVPLALALARASEFVEPAAALPVYLRDSTAWRRQ